MTSRLEAESEGAPLLSVPKWGMIRFTAQLSPKRISSHIILLLTSSFDDFVFSKQVKCSRVVKLFLKLS